MPKYFEIDLIAFECGNPTQNLTNLKQIYASGSGGSYFSYPQTLSIMCEVGYEWLGQYKNTINCSRFGTWNYWPKCQGLFYKICYSFAFNTL